MPTRRSQPTETPPDLPAEKAYSVLSTQLKKIQDFKGHNYQEARAAEGEWFQFTEKLIIRAFGSGSTNYTHFRFAQSAGQHRLVAYGRGIDHAQNQRNFEARLQAYEAALRSCLSELEIDLPNMEVRGVYEPGEEYEFYHDVTTCLGFAQKEIFVIDPYLNVEIFDVYANAIPRTVYLRLLSANVPADVRTLGQKYASGGNFAFRAGPSIHDRVIFADNRVWLCGQSLKDAAKKKPIYIVEHDCGGSSSISLAPLANFS